MISLQTKNTYSEIFELMKYIDRNDLNKIPEQVLVAIKENRNESYVPKIDLENINNSLSKDTLALYIWLYKTYMVKNKQEVQEINKILYDNENKKSIDVTSNIFNKKILDEKEEDKKDKELIVYKESFIKKLINKLKKIFDKSKR